MVAFARMRLRACVFAYMCGCVDASVCMRVSVRSASVNVAQCVLHIISKCKQGVVINCVNSKGVHKSSADQKVR